MSIRVLYVFQIAEQQLSLGSQQGSSRACQLLCKEGTSISVPAKPFSAAI
jgi:hypothetical protein